MQGVDYVKIGKRIREARKAQNLTQEAASEKCDITSAYYGNIERGDKKMSIETLAKISQGLNLPVDYLLFGETQDELAPHLSEIKHLVGDNQMEKYLTVIKAIAGIIEQLQGEIGVNLLILRCAYFQVNNIQLNNS